MSVIRTPNGAIPLPAAPEPTGVEQVRQTVMADHEANPDTLTWVRVNRAKDKGPAGLVVNSYLIEDDLEMAIRALQAAMAMLQELAATIHAKQTGVQLDYNGRELTRQ